MTDQYLRLAERPALRHPGYPTCDACNIETDHEDGDWLCPSCGTVWPGDNLEADAADATLYPDWSGETLTAPPRGSDLPARHGRAPRSRSPKARDHLLSPGLVRGPGGYCLACGVA